MPREAGGGARVGKAESVSITIDAPEAYRYVHAAQLDPDTGVIVE